MRGRYHHDAIGKHSINHFHNENRKNISEDINNSLK